MLHESCVKVITQLSNFSYDNFIKQKKIYINNMLNLEKYYKDDTQEIANLNGLILNLNKSWNKYWNNLDSKKLKVKMKLEYSDIPRVFIS